MFNTLVNTLKARLINTFSMMMSELGELGIAQWLERLTRDRKVEGSSPCRSGGIIFFYGGNFNSVLTLISVSVTPPCKCCECVVRFGHFVGECLE